jgi:hypothetical protein
MIPKAMTSETITFWFDGLTNTPVSVSQLTNEFNI